MFILTLDPVQPVTAAICVKNDFCLGERVISCSTCNSWYHVACLSSSFQNSLKNSSAVWLCARCGTRNYSIDLLSQDISYFSSPNSFSLFTSTTTQEIHSRHSETPIANCGKARPLKLLTVNVNSLLAKRVELRQFLFDNSIDVMIARETKIDENVLDSELNLNKYDIETIETLMVEELLLQSKSVLGLIRLRYQISFASLFV